jgi:peptidoglycan/xylan/chitin deacetylase (PgdA/CDA1 family)
VSLARHLAAAAGRLALPVVERVWAPPVTVFMLHRFADPEPGVEGHDPGVLREALALLRRLRIPVRALAEVVSDLAAGRPLGRAVVFTVDDGYADFARVGAPVFAEFDVPVTLFVTTGFVDGAFWFWWDRLHLALERTRVKDLDVELDGVSRHRLGAGPARSGFEHRLVEMLKRLPERDREERLAQVLRQLDVELPARPPERFAPIGWEAVPRLEAAGVSFGPHTVTHPALAAEDETRARREMQESWDAVRSRAGAAVPVFCWPYGMAWSWSGREEGLLAGLGLKGAVTALPGYLSGPGAAWSLRGNPGAMPRFSWEEPRHRLVQIVTGAEGIKGRVRGGRV